MRTTLTLDDDVLDAARDIAAGSGRRLGEVVSELARRSLSPVGWRMVDGIPTFEVSADSPGISAADVSKALDDE